MQLVIINVYGPTQTIDKLAVWNEINTFINSMPQETFILGDFNVVLRKEEKHGGNNPVFRAMEDFKNWIQKDSLIDITTKNGIYTWNNKRKGFCNIA